MSVSTRHVIIVPEDELCEAIMRRLLQDFRSDLVIDRVVLARGFGFIKSRVEVFKKASKIYPHLVLTDLDQVACAPTLLASWRAVGLPPELWFRIAVREVEAWLLSDREGIAAFLEISVANVPLRPEAERDPKGTLLALARRSRNRALREDLLPASGSRAAVGIGYNSRLSNFVAEGWNVERAVANAESLDKALQRLSGFLQEDAS